MLTPKLNPISSIDEDKIVPLQHYGPVTSLKIFKNYIFCGYGPTLKVFKVNNESSTTPIVFEQQVFARNKIHHIEFSKSGKNLVLTGARSFTVLNFAAIINNEDIEIEEKAINEWIVSAAFKDENELLLLNSHNTIYQIDTTTFEFVDKIHCDEKSILYSGSIRILDDGRILIAAGTVMTGVIVWDLNTKTILYNLKEHEGSIFGVEIDETGNYLISCSDDRSVKLYNFNTGNVLATGWGHASRIWQLKFFKDQSSIKILSAGEDCTLRYWKYEPENELLIQTALHENAHSGKHIWSADIDDTDLLLSVTGGADGRIRLHDLQLKKSHAEYSIELIESQASVKFEKKETINQLIELPTIGLNVILTSRGKILVLVQEANTFYEVDLEEKEREVFINFGIMKAFKEIDTVVICSRKGDLLFLEFSKVVKQPTKLWIRDEYLSGSMVTNMLIESNNDIYYVMLDSPNPKIPFILYQLKYSNSIQLIKTQKLVQPNQSFTTTTMILDKANNWLIFGSRYVSMAVYDLNHESESVELKLLSKKISPGDAITSVSIINSKIDLVTLLITVRDGVYMILQLSKLEDGFLKFEIVHQNKLSRGFVEGGYFDGNDLILIGFRSSSFYIWNETKQIELASELCGGSHRLWELFRYGNNSNFKFAYIKKSYLHISSFNERFHNQDYGLINAGTHGREIRDVTISPVIKNNSRYLMTASEDTTVRLSSLDVSGKIYNHWSMNAHVSGLQKIRFIDETYIASSAANEEFIIWKLEHIDSKIPVLKPFCKLLPSSDIPDLRIMDFDVIQKEGGFFIATAYSNSNIKLWYFDIEKKQFSNLHSEYYSSCCIFNLKMIEIGSSTSLIITASDGHAALWDISNIVANLTEKALIGELLIKQQLHQNGIKAALFVKNESGYDFFTGGDDNALIHSSIQMKDDKISLDIVHFIENAASSSITSISKGKKNSIIVTSVDQILREWSYESEELKCISARYTSIADTGCSDSTLLNDNIYAVVAGSGLSVFKLA